MDYLDTVHLFLDVSLGFMRRGTLNIAICGCLRDLSFAVYIIFLRCVCHLIFTQSLTAQNQQSRELGSETIAHELPQQLSTQTYSTLKYKNIHPRERLNKKHAGCVQFVSKQLFNFFSM